MLIEFYGQNFGCFRDEFRLSMLATDIDPNSDRGIVEVKVEGDDEPLRLLRAVAIYGPNASGKSTVLRAAGALRYLISRTSGLRSDAPLGPYEPFAGSEKSSPVHLGIKAIIDGQVYRYEVQFDKTTFLVEHLAQLRPDTEMILFHREAQNVSGDWTKDEIFSLISKDFRPNAMLLSLADKLAPALAKNIAVGFRKLLRVTDVSTVPWTVAPEQATSKRMKEDRVFRGWLLSQLKSADFGVVDVRMEEMTMTVSSNFIGEISDEGNDIDKPETFYRLSLLHRGTGGDFAIPVHRESRGTQRLLDLAPVLYDLAHDDNPKAVFIDEIHESLHPTLLQALLGHFNCDIPMIEVCGQLIFATHETFLMDAEAKNAVLRRDQIYLTEKDTAGAARLYSVAEFRERNNLNIRRRYLQGRYGALPALGSFS